MKTAINENGYLQIAQTMTYNMDMTEQAMNAARTQDESEREELILASQKRMCEALLTSWRDSKKAIMKEWRKAINNLAAAEKVYFKLDLHDDEYDTASKIYHHCAGVSQSLSASIDAIREAIDYLQSYLHPSEGEGKHQTEDLPFESNWKVIAQSTAPAQFKTPQEAAVKLVNDIMDNATPEIAAAWKESQSDPRTQYTIFDCSAWYDLLFQHGESEFKSNQVGWNELERACSADEMQECIMIVNEAIQEELS